MRTTNHLQTMALTYQEICQGERPWCRHLEIRGGGDKLEGKFQRRKKKMEWYRRDKEAVAAALRRGERPDLATTMASGPLDELVALHEELGIFAVLDEVEPQRVRAG